MKYSQVLTNGKSVMEEETLRKALRLKDRIRRLSENIGKWRDAIGLEGISVKGSSGSRVPVDVAILNFEEIKDAVIRSLESELNKKKEEFERL